MHFKRWPSDDRESSKSNLILNKTLFYKLFSLNEGKIATFETPQLPAEEDSRKEKSKTIVTTETIKKLQKEGNSEIYLLIMILIELKNCQHRVCSRTPSDQY